MKDINFDELDKAVNSVLEGGGPATDVPKPDDTADTPTDKPVSDDTPADPKPAAPEKTTVPATPNPSSNPSSPIDKGRRSGRFMDVVHPQQSKKPEIITSKANKTLTPLNDDVKPEEPEPHKAPEPAKVPEEPVAVEPQSNEPSAPEPVETPVLPETKLEETPPAETKASATDQVWPDPLDVHGFKYEEEDVKDDKKKADDTPEKPDTDDKEESKAPDADKPEEPEQESKTVAAEAPSTPFLEGTKVEKRPLGAFSDPDTAAEPKEAPASQQPGDSVAGAMPGDVPSPIPDKLPPELSEDVLAVEGGEFNDHTPAKPESEPQADKPEAEESTAEGAGPAVNSAGSIPQQYKESQAGEAEKGEQTSHHMLSTQDHQTPLLEPPHHSKHAALWITLAIIILLATGAGFAWWFLIATA
jgi:hypothetical protein